MSQEWHVRSMKKDKIWYTGKSAFLAPPPQSAINDGTSKLPFVPMHRLLPSCLC